MSEPNKESQDVIGQAIATARAANIRTDMRALKVIAPAKVNLHLGVGAAGEDGFHAVETVLQAISLHDVLFMRSEPAEPGSGLAINLSCTFHGVDAASIEPEKNLAYRAVSSLAKAIGHDADETVTMLLEKHIPLQAGLGGGSSDAAAALVGAARMWGVSAEDARLEEVARTLGADVAFFLRGGCGLYDGKGDVFVRSLEPSRSTLVLVKPEAGVSTAEAYRTFDATPDFVEDGEREALGSAAKAEDVALRNNLASAAESLVPELAEVREWMSSQDGVSDVLLSGSGAATFAVCESFERACVIATEARKRGWWSRTTSCSSARAAIVPNR